MEALRIALIESARVLGVSVQTDAFRSALDLGTEALLSGYDEDSAIEFARRALLHSLPVANAA